MQTERNNMFAHLEIDQMAQTDFHNAVAKAFRRRVTSWITRTNNDLLSFEVVYKHSPSRGRHHAGLRTVAVENIVGSVGRCRDFDQDFCPRREEQLERWTSIDRAYYRETTLPPIELYKVANDFFVVDGHHRVSVARAHGQAFIDGHVIKIEVAADVTDHQPAPSGSGSLTQTRL